MFLIFDTETTTFPSSKLDARDTNQARVIQLAWLLLNNNFKEVASFSSLIKLNDKYTISEGAFRAHGISKEMCNEGTYPIQAMTMFIAVQKCANIRVAHNLNFDSQMLEIESANTASKSDYDFSLKVTESICTMQLMMPICKLPHKSNRNFGQQYKWPTLQEAHKHCFGHEFEGAHDALNDVRATARIFKWLIDNGHICLPQITTQTTSTQQTMPS